MVWTGDYTQEPPAEVLAVQDDYLGEIMDRTPEACQWCESGSIWKWRHNSTFECWMDMDGIGPFTQVPPLS